MSNWAPEQAVLALRLQQSGGLECLPTSWQRLLSATPLEILSTFKARPPSRFPVSAGEVIGLARALAPLILLPDEHRDDALALQFSDLVSTNATAWPCAAPTTAATFPSGVHIFCLTASAAPSRMRTGCYSARAALAAL